MSALTRHALIAFAVLVALALVAAPAARATDSHAPDGATHRWLPTEDWVMYHWLPYDEAALYRELGIGRAGVRRWLRDDRRTLAGLARRRGIDPRGLGRRLVLRSTGGRGGARVALRIRRAERTLTQGHLAQHVLLHVHHQPAIGLEARRLFGVEPSRYMLMRLNGRSPAQIAGAGTPAARRRLGARVARVLRDSAASGVSAGVTSPRQARTFLIHQRRGLAHWLDTSIRGPRVRRLLTPVPRSRTDVACYLFQGRLCATPFAGHRAGHPTLHRRPGAPRPHPAEARVRWSPAGLVRPLVATSTPESLP